MRKTYVGIATNQPTRTRTREGVALLGRDGADGECGDGEDDAGELHCEWVSEWELG